MENSNPNESEHSPAGEAFESASNAGEGPDAAELEAVSEVPATEAPTVKLPPPEQVLEPAEEPAKFKFPVDERPKLAAEEAKPLAASWIENALEMLRRAELAAEPDAPPDIRIGSGLDIVRRHFHTDKRAAALTEPAAIRLIEKHFLAMRGALNTSGAIFISADDETASKNTRGYFGSGLTVAAYAFAYTSISFTSDFPSLGPKCRAAVIVHQLAHFIDAGMTDQSCGGLIYDLADFETSLYNVHCYPNFAVNATPPYLDERYGMTRPEI